MIYARDAPNFGYNSWRKMGQLRVRREALNWGEISLPKLVAVGPNISTADMSWERLIPLSFDSVDV